jgi:hypothetical protein
MESESREKALLRRKKRTDKLYQSCSSYMCCMTYFDTITHPYQKSTHP